MALNFFNNFLINLFTSTSKLSLKEKPMNNVKSFLLIVFLFSSFNSLLAQVAMEKVVNAPQNSLRMMDVDEDGNIICLLSFGDSTVYNGVLYDSEVYFAKFSPAGEELIFSKIMENTRISNIRERSFLSSTGELTFITEIDSEAIVGGEPIESSGGLHLVKVSNQGEVLSYSKIDLTFIQNAKFYFNDAGEISVVYISNINHDITLFGNEFTVEANKYVFNFNIEGNLISDFSFSDNTDRNYDFKKHNNGYHLRMGAFLNYTIYHFNNDGEEVWQKSISGGESDGFDVDDDGNLYMTLAYQSNFDFEGINITTLDFYDLLFFSYDIEGNLLWYKTIKSQGDDDELFIKYYDGSLFYLGDFHDEQDWESELFVSNTAMVFAEMDTDGEVLYVDIASPSNDFFLSAFYDSYLIPTDDYIYFYQDFGAAILRLCKDWSAECLTLVSNENQEISDVKIYPNPTSDYINVSNLEQDIYQYEVYNQVGQMILSDVLHSEINVSTLSDGYYWISVYSADKSLVVNKAFVKN